MPKRQTTRSDGYYHKKVWLCCGDPDCEHEWREEVEIENEAVLTTHTCPQCQRPFDRTDYDDLYETLYVAACKDAEEAEMERKLEALQDRKECGVGYGRWAA